MEARMLRFENDRTERRHSLGSNTLLAKAAQLAEAANRNNLRNGVQYARGCTTMTHTQHLCFHFRMAGSGSVSGMRRPTCLFSMIARTPDASRGALKRSDIS